MIQYLANLLTPFPLILLEIIKEKTSTDVKLEIHICEDNENPLV